MALSPLARRRLAAFRANRRGWWSFLLLLALLALVLPADLVANDRPLLVWTGTELLSPALFGPVSEARLGGSLPLPADFRDPSVLEFIAARAGWVLFPPVSFGADTVNYAVARPLPAPPDGLWGTPEGADPTLCGARPGLCRNVLGTDDQGRDLLARLIHGLRLSLLFALGLTALAAALGIALGGVMGFLGGRTDLVLQRLVEIWRALPVLILVIIVASLVRLEFGLLLLVVAAFSWMPLTDVVRAEVLRARALDYVRAARALGVRRRVILVRHVLPNAAVAALTLLPFIATGAVTTLTSLDFLGFGLPPGAPSLGELLRQGKANLHAPWLGLIAFAALATVLLLLTFVGEAARDAADPRRVRGQAPAAGPEGAPDPLRQRP